MSQLSFSLAQEIKREKLYLVIEIEEESRAPKRVLYRDTLLSLAKDKEKQAIAYLIQQELRFLGIAPLSSQADTAAFNRIRIPAENSMEAIKLLAATSRLFWKGRSLIVDPFSKMELFFEVTSHEKGGIVVRGKWRLQNHEGDLSDVQWIFPGRPHWMIKEGVLQQLSGEVSWKWVEFVYPEAKRLEGSKEKHFLDQFEGESPQGAPRVIWKINPKADPVETTLPFLKLSDRTGAFADLWIDYGALGKVAVHDPTHFPWRKKEIEKSWEKDLLETDFIKKIVGTTHYFCPLDKVAKSLTFLLEVGWQIFDYRGKKVVKQQREELSLQMEQEKILLKGRLAYEEHTVDLKDLVGAFNKRERFLDLSPHHVALIDRETLGKRWGEMEEAEIMGEGVALPKHHFGLLEEFLADEKVSRDAGVSSLAERIKNSAGVVGALPSERFAGTLHPYQQEGVNWLAFLSEGGFHGLLADEMGLGKTVQMLAFLSRLEIKEPVLIVMPTSLLFNWRREIERFLPGSSLYVHSGSHRCKNSKELGAHRLILTSYALLRHDIDLFKQLSYELVVLDEAQAIKNPESQIAQCASALQSKKRLAVTGTPIENSWDDLWSIFSFLMPELLGERQEFKAALLAAQGDERHLVRLRKKLRPFILRRKKEEVALQLPPKEEQIVWIELPEAQRAFYEEWLSKRKGSLAAKVSADGAAVHRMEILETILRLRQICCDPALVEPGFEGGSGKLERLLSDLEEVISQGRKVLVYSQFTQMLGLLRTAISDKGWKTLYLDGSTRNREEIIQKFQEDPESKIFLISLKAGGVGLNLTAADYVFLYDPWWNVAVEQQAIDRAHRMGRQGSVIARRYVSVFTIEEKMMRLKEHKAALSKGLIEIEEVLEQLSLDQLYELIN